MSDQKSTISIGFKTDTNGLDQANRRVDRLKQRLKEIAKIGGGTRIADVSENAIRGGQRIQGGSTGRGFNITGNLGRGIARRGVAGSLAAFGALGVGLGATAMITKAISAGKEYLQVLDPLTKQLSIVGHGEEEFAQSLERTGEAIGKNRREMVRLTQAYTQLAGQQGGNIANQMKISSLLAKGMGVETGLMGSSMGSFAQMGAFGQYGNGNMRMERFAAMIADSIAKGGMKGREGELFSSIQSLMGTQLNILTRLAPGGSDNMLGMLTAFNKTGQPGLMGMRGANVLSRMNANFMNPQGEFGDYFMYNALGGGDYFDYRMRREQGIFGEGNFSAVQKYLKKNFKDPKSRWHAMSSMFGISMHQAKAVDEMDPEKNEEFIRELGSITGGDLSHIDPSKFGLMAQIYNADDSKRAELLKDSRIADLAKTKGWNAQTDVSEILKGISESEMKGTSSERMLTELSKIDNEIEKFGKKAIPIMTKTLESVRKIVNHLVPDEENNKPTLKDKVELGLASSGNPIFMYKIIKDLLSGDDEEAKQDVIPQPSAGSKDDSDGVKGVVSKIGSGLAESFDPIVAGLGDLITQIQKQMNIEVKVVDERTAGDGNAVKAK